MYALIQKSDNAILKVGDIYFELSPDKPFYWKECPKDCTTNWTFDGVDFISPIAPQPDIYIPSVVSMRQARLALLQEGIISLVNENISQGSEADKITWEYATEVNRSDALVTNLSVALGLTEQQLNDLFLLASSL